ncbi:MAG TPA: DUF4375 domain-containing protein [Phycisphaerae bacterium]|nr:DUF4375 domain-containing protein [Phycisphaerae bacterium]
MPPSDELPRLDRFAFYQSTDENLPHEIAAAVYEYARKNPSAPIADNSLTLYVWSKVANDVPNGGFAQFFFNYRGDTGVDALCKLLTHLQLPDLARQLTDAVAIYQRNRDQFESSNPWERPFGKISEFNPLDRTFSGTQGNAVLGAWARQHIAELVIGDDAQPIDPTFSGTLKAYHPNGSVARTLEVKHGRADGVYREFFDDGTPRLFECYEAGNSVGDFWPSGQVQKTRVITDATRTIEWFFPNAQLQKRMVLDRKGKPLEPIRLFYENGQLAEEISVQNGKKHGPWLRFFDDGSPKLQAEVLDDGKVLVHNAWDPDRSQIVTNGNGIYEDDGHNIDTKLQPVSDSKWRDISELKDGLRHGISKRYEKETIWSVSHYRNGIQHGESTLYWDNGRIRSVSLYAEGTEVSTRQFPKFDHPVPAVLLDVTTVHEQFPRWQYPPADIDAIVLNLDEVRAQLTIPQFLLDVHHRNQSGQLKSKYENCNEFNDTIGYALAVGPSGEIIEAKATGSGTYSGREWNTYVPLLKQIRFSPAQRQGRPVPSRAFARVHHTFVEALGAQPSTSGTPAQRSQ